MHLPLLLFPRICPACERTLLSGEESLCTACQSRLPLTGFSGTPLNLAEQRLLGRIPFDAASAYLHFDAADVSRDTVHNIKYHGNIRLAHALGQCMGRDLLQSDRFGSLDAIVPVPLHRRREHHRGFNQSEALARGMADIMHLPVLTRHLVRIRNTPSQTLLPHDQRLANVQGAFAIRRSKALQGRHLLLVDDVLTTGATLEACAQALLTVPDVTLSIATLSIA
ncbi:MAG: ComF family protein [Bacteroidales bacterium]|nr:ComF family protein [Bacteroidales bacterium]